MIVTRSDYGFHSTDVVRPEGHHSVSLQDVHARLEAQFGGATYSEWSVGRWCQYVRQGREDLHAEVQSGGPPVNFHDIRILALLDEQPFVRFVRVLNP
jgi:hypothetical protein